MGAPRSKTIKSEQFDDVYFSAVDGLAETRHVFLDGNGLPEAMVGQDCFVVGETGFGTGLNFLALWDAFREVAVAGQKMHFISVEKYPLKRDQIEDALGHWEQLDDLREALLAVYPDDASGVFEHDFGDVKLSVYFEDVVDGFKRVEGAVDAWFLDGFRPSSNPQMWTDEVFEQVARLSVCGSTFATFTSAGFVRRGLKAVGFDVRKISGFGHKREMSVGVFR